MTETNLKCACKQGPLLAALGTWRYAENLTVAREQGRPPKTMTVKVQYCKRCGKILTQLKKV